LEQAEPENNALKNGYIYVPYDPHHYTFLFSYHIIMKIKNVARDSILALLYSLRLTSSTVSNGSLLTIVTFHRVLPQNLRKKYPFPGLVITPEEFRWIMHTLIQLYDCGSVTDMMSKWKKYKKPNKPLMAITFDDGQEDNYRYAVPILKALGVKATFYIPVSAVEEGGMLWHDLLGFTVLHLFKKGPELGRVNEFIEMDFSMCRSPVEAARAVVRRAKSMDQQERVKFINFCTDKSYCPDWAGMMTWKQLRQLTHDGYEIGSHSMTHSILPRCSDTELKTEIIESRKILQEKLKVPVSTFCYPNGDVDERISKLTKKAGYTCAVTTEWKANRQKDNMFNLGRCDINPSKFLNFRGKLSKTKLAWRLSKLKRFLENLKKDDI
jgi:peptidoglycan/xylan/chitin deacetylase (PgdA/CDA1 family)